MGLFSAIGGLAGGILGDSQASEAQAQALEAKRQALAAIQGIYVPTVDEQKINLEDYALAGELNPTMEQLESLGPSAMQEISTDPRLRDAQMSALAKMQAEGSSGMNAQDRLTLNTARNSASRADRGRREQVLQQMAQRGMGGSGAELAAQLASSQNALVADQQSADQQAAAASARALQAIAQSGTMGGQIRSQDFNESAQKAQAADAINKFNASNRQGLNTRNTDRNNSASQFNLTNKQNVMNRNTDTNNTEETHNKGLYQQKFNNDMTKGQGLAGQYTNMSNYYSQDADRTRQKWANIGLGAGQVGDSAVGYFSGTGAGGGGGTAGAGGPNLGANTDFGSGLSADQLSFMKDEGDPHAGYARFAHGGTVPGKAPYPGDDSRNDIVPAMLSPGEKIVPRSEAGKGSDDTHESVSKLLEAISSLVKRKK
jgi:hypothetical protein